MAPAQQLKDLIQEMLRLFHAIQNKQGDLDEAFDQLNVYVDQAKPLIDPIRKELGNEGDAFYKNVFTVGKCVFFKYTNPEDVGVAISAANEALSLMKKANLIS